MANAKQKTIDTIMQKLRQKHGEGGMDYSKKRRLLDRQTLKILSMVLADMDAGKA